MVSQTLRFTSDQPIKQWLTERKTCISPEQKCVLDEIKPEK